MILTKRLIIGNYVPPDKVLMPFRAFDDSDVLLMLTTSGMRTYVLMPFRAFDDSDSHTTRILGVRFVGLNALPGIR